ncbi:outer membrane beta-barrel protein [Sphingobacterium lactis]|uniref:Carboxypeptidase regulatory-like domain-containing protein n=1 Tax=Sphingobacterium lactis TaxID=797291 RepID=A0A1H5VWY9_9SPHI|nr:outer membrane beta-barrel protein [Sphingobacterium lactis]SEF91643.1 Carboxypeptidase regulatory-like domain-containing protein [Sphingobacterium lactis]
MDKIMKALMLLCIMAMSASVFAQSGRVVQGMLRDTESRPISGASVRLFSDKDTMATSSNNAGFFTFENVKGTKLTVRVSSLGFSTFEKEVDFPEGQKQIQVPSFELAVNENQIEEVVIQGVPTVRVVGDTVEYTTRDLKLREGSVAEDALKKLQGVEVDKDGNVTAQGESITRVRINGKDFFGGDVKTATQNLPANIIEKIQVVDDYGDMANVTGNKTGDSEKIINIQIDPKYNKGYMTTLRAGYGTEDRYQATAMWMGMTDKTQVSVLGNLNNINAPLFDFNTMGGGARRRQGGGGRPGGGGGMFGRQDGLTNVGSVGVNIRHDFSEKLKVYGNYSYGRDDNNTVTNRLNQYYFDAGTQEEKSESDANNISASHRLEANLEWNITDKDYIKLTPQFGFNDNSVRSNSFSQFFDINRALQNQDADTLINGSNAPRYSISGLYNRKLNDRGRNLFINFNYDNAATNSDFDRILDRLINDPNNAEATTEEIYQRTLQEVKNKSWNAGTSVSYTEPLSKNGKLEVTYDFNKNSYDNHRFQEARNEDGTLYPNDDLSIVNFDYNQDYSFTTHRIGANFAYENDKIKYSLGAAVQPSLLKGVASSSDESTIIDRNNFNIIPIARFEYKFSRQKNISINYSGRSNEPSVDQILPYVVSQNETNKIYGNPELNPEFRHQMMLRFRSGDFQKGNTFFAFMNANLTNNKIVSFMKRVPGTEKGMLQETRYLNETEEPIYGVNSFYHFGKSLKQKTYNLMLMGGVNYNKNVSYTSNEIAAVEGMKNIANNFIIMQGLFFRYNPSENLELNPGVRYSYNFTKNSITDNNSEVSTWTPTFIGSVNITPSTIFGADVSKSFNKGYGSLSNANPFIINTYIEQKLLKGQRGTIRLQAFDLLDEQVNLARTVQDNFSSDTQTNRLGRYFMLTFTFKLQKFSGMAPSEESGFPGMRRPRM